MACELRPGRAIGVGLRFEALLGAALQVFAQAGQQGARIELPHGLHAPQQGREAAGVDGDVRSGHQNVPW